MSYYVHVIGPDDVHKCESLVAALRLQADYTQSALKLAEQGGEHMPAVWANIISEDDVALMWGVGVESLRGSFDPAKGGAP